MDALAVNAPTPAVKRAAHGVTLAQAFHVWLRVACLSFGGPAGQIAVMHRIIVEEKSGSAKADFHCMR